MKNKIVLWLVAIVMFVLCLPTNVLNFIASAETTQSAYFYDEMWDSENNTFNKAVVEAAINFLTIDSEAETNEYPVDRLYDLASFHTSYEDIMENAAFPDATVKFPFTIGGLTWLPTFLSTDKDGNVILTLWLLESEQEAWSSYQNGSIDESNSYTQMYNGSLYCDYSFSDNYMYSTSIARSFGLNNASDVVITSNDLDGLPVYETYTQNPNHPFALFTMENSAFTDYIVTPRNVVWQEYQGINILETSSNSDGTVNETEYFGMLNYIYSYIKMFKDLMGNEIIYEASDMLTEYCNTFLSKIMTPTNDGWSSDIVNDKNQEQLYEVVDWYLMILDYQAQNTTDETELTEIEQMRQQVAYLVEEYSPYVATDKYGNYYNFYNTGGLNYQDEPYYGDWADDYLWLPSASEIAPKEMGAKSIWESVSYMVANQATEIDASLGLNYSNNTLLRSAAGYGAVAFHEDGTDFVFDKNENKYALRPAFNLNLTKIIKELGLEETKSRYVRIDEIWDEQNQDFNKNNLSQLYNYVAGQEMSDLNTISAVLDASENGVLSARDIKANEVGKKGSGKDIIVKIGGYDWYVTYLSKSKNDEPVLTLWQTNSFQAKNTYNKNLFFAPFTAYMAGSIFSIADTDMYSAAPLRIFALNNKESFYIGSQEEIPAGSSLVVDENGYYDYVPRLDNPFSLFTVEELGFTQYLTTPRNIAWQEFQNGSEILNLTCFSNDSWSDEIVDGENGYEFGLSTNYAGEENNSAWADDYLWLPSFTEVCFYESYDIDEILDYSMYGLWQITGEQFKNYNGKDTSLTAFTTDTSYPTSYLFRSGANQMQNSSGSVVPGLLSITADGQIVTAEVEGALRPAMHLNLASLPSLSVSGLNIISSRSVYSGSSKLENIDFAFDGTELTHNTDYTFEVFFNGLQVDDIVNAGTYTIVFNGLGDYADYQGVEFNYTVGALNISTQATTAITAIPPYSEDIGEIFPEIEVYYYEELLVEGVDYTLSFANNTYPTAKAEYTVNFIGNYTGSLTRNFLIAGINLSEVGISSSLKGEHFYCDCVTNHKYSPATVYAEGVLLQENIDYTWYYLNFNDENDKTGENLGADYFIMPKTIYIIVEGKGNYTGTASIYYYIDSIDASRLTITYNIETYTYNGEEYKPTVEVKFGDTVLTEQTDYTISYNNNINATNENSKAKINLSFKNIYTGYVTQTFEILPRDISKTVLQDEIPEYTYISSIDRIFPEYTLIDEELNNTALHSGLDFSASSSYFINAGTYNITLTGRGNYTGTKIITVIVNKAKIERVEVCIAYESSNRKTDKSTYYSPDNALNLGEQTMIYVITLKPNGDARTESLTSLRLTNTSNYKAFRNGVETTDFTSIGEITFKFYNLDTNNVYQPEGEYFEQVITIDPDEITTATVSNAIVDTVYDVYSGVSGVVKPEVTARCSGVIDSSNYKINYYKLDEETNTYSTEVLTSVKDAGKYKWVVVSTSPNYVVSGSVGGYIVINTKKVDTLYFEYFYVDEQGNYTNALGEIVDNKVFVETSTGEYSGLPLEVDVYYSSSKTKKLVEGVDYSVVKDDSLLESENKYTLTISNVSTNYEGTVVTDFYKNLYRIDTTKISVLTTYEYNFGLPIELNPDDLTLTNIETDEVLTYGQDYTFYTGEITVGNNTITVDKFRHNTDSGTATAYIQGLGNYIGVASANYRIESLHILSNKISGSFVTSTNDFSYRKTEITPAVAHDSLVQGVDYIVSYSDNKNVGTATIFVTGNGNYKGETTFNFNIVTKNIADNDISYNPTLSSAYVYQRQTGISNKVRLYYDLSAYSTSSVFLKEGTDYDLKFYRNGEQTTNEYGVGNIHVVLTGKNGFEGSREFDVEIIPKNIELSSNNLASSYTYKTNKSVEVVIRDGTYVMIENQDYTISLTRNSVPTFDLSSAGTVAYSITGINNYTGVIVGTFIIEKGEISNFSEPDYQYTYNREVQEPKPFDVYDTNGEIIDESEYEITYYKLDEQTGEYNLIDVSQIDFTTPATYKIVATSNTTKNNYEGFCEVGYSISKKSIADILSSTNFDQMLEDKEFTNEEIRQDIQINFGDYGLVEGEDYRVIYDKNKDTGKVTVKVEGMGNYSGDVDGEFEITSKPIEDIVLEEGLNLSNLVIVKQYTGQNVSLTDDDFTGLIPYGSGYLTPGVDFTYDYEEEERVEMGEYIVTLTGVGNYKNAVNITMQVSAIDFATSLRVGDIPNQTYNGYAKQPELTFYINEVETVLAEGVDYDISYSANINAGVARIVLTGKGIYSGSYQTSFSILPKTIEDSQEVSFTYTQNFVYSSEPVSVNLQGYFNPNVNDYVFNLQLGKDYGVVTYNDRNANQIYDEGVDDQVTSSYIASAGSYLLKVYGGGNYTGQLYLPFEVQKLNLAQARSEGLISITGVENSYVYCGQAINPTVNVWFKDSTNISLTDFNFSYGENTLVATGGSIIIESKLNSNFEGSISLMFAIEKAILTVEVDLKDKEEILYEGKPLPEIVVTNEVGVEGTLKYSASNNILSLGTNAYEWVFTPVDTDNYNIVYGVINITAQKVEMPWALIGGVAAGIVALTILIIILIKKKKKKNGDEIGNNQLKALSKMKENDVRKIAQNNNPATNQNNAGNQNNFGNPNNPGNMQ